MKGIRAQPGWTFPAAATALSGIALMFFIGWSYFEGASASSHRHVTCRADCRALELWVWAHLPLYLGVALAGVGAEHAVRMGGWQALNGEEPWLVALAVALSGLALAALRAVTVGPRRA